MATGKKGLLEFNIAGKKMLAPLEWQDISILASFDNGNVQANITSDQFTVVNETAKEIIKYIENGLNGGVGIFEGLPVSIVVKNDKNKRIAFDGFADLTNEFKDSTSFNSRVEFSIVKSNGLNEFNEQLKGHTYGYLESIGVFSDRDYRAVKYVVEKENNAMEIITIGITTFLMTKELAESSYKTAEAIAEAASILAGGGLTGSLGATIISVAKAILLITYNAILLSAIIKLMDQLINLLIPFVREGKGCTLYTLLNNVCNYLGYSFDSDITELNSYCFLPSNNNADEYDKGFIVKHKGTSKGIPNSGDGGYLCSEMFSIVQEMFNGRYSIIGNTVYFRNIDSDFWKKKSTYKMPSVLEKIKGYNTQELVANRIFSFATDVTDEWTTLNFKGTNYETITDAVTVNNVKAKYIKGLEQLNNPWALGSRKDKLNAVEELLKVLAGTIDSITGIFGGGTNYKGKIKSKIGMLKVSSNNYNVAKILYLDVNGKIPSNHRDMLSAKYLVSTYHFGKSFVQNGFYGQKITYNNVRIPFGFEDFIKTIENSYFTNDNGEECKIEKIEYNISSDTANVDYWIRRKYTVNLKETYIEA